jgi:hypothetical protein
LSRRSSKSSASFFAHRRLVVAADPDEHLVLDSLARPPTRVALVEGSSKPWFFPALIQPPTIDGLKRVAS